MSVDSKRIAKNTIFLYARMLLIMGVTLYTSRIVLEVLGVEDYGLYFTIFSVIGMLAFLNGTLSGGTSRFITYELGRGDPQQLQTTFSTAWYTHLMLAGLIIIIASTLGLWYVNNILKVPAEQKIAALWVYFVSVLSSVMSIIQVPFTAEIIAHERMNVYAYLGIYEAIAKLGVVFLLLHTSFVKIVFYAWLQFAVVVSVFIFYIIYNLKNFKEVTFRNKFDSSIFKSLMKFSGWNILANICNTLSQQGVIMLFNFFFAPFVVAAQAISNQISNAAGQFVNNIRQAVNPQIIKLYADDQYEASQSLTLKSAEYIYYLLLLVGVPIIMVMPCLLSIWLKDVPEYSVAFARLMILQLILDNFNAAFYTPMIAANKVSQNAIYATIVISLQFILTWVVFKWFHANPLWARYLGIIGISFLSFLIKPYILKTCINYSKENIYQCLRNCFKITVPIIILCTIIYYSIPQSNLFLSFCVGFISFFSILVCTYLFVGKMVRERINLIILAYLKKIK